MTQSITIEINGRTSVDEVDARTHLGDHLREVHGLTGTHLGCEHGVCGACTVMVDGEPTRSCISFARACDELRVRTIEGFDDDPLMAALRAAFKKHHGLQCGFCTPGMLISAYDIVRRIPAPDEARVRRELAGNLCRCTGYRGIVRAVLEVGALRGTFTQDQLLEPVPAASGVTRGISDSAPRHLPGLGSAPRVSAGARSQAGQAGHRVEKLEQGWRLHLGVAAPILWAILIDIEAVMQCMPGASLRGPVLSISEASNTVPFSLAVAIGPMRSQFEGDVQVSFDAQNMAGQLQGQGLDAASRTQAHGNVSFTIVPAGQGATLDLAVDYQLKGELAQYSRGAVVDAVTEQLLLLFAQNIARLAGGESVDAQAEISGVGLVGSVFWRRLKRFFF